MGRELAPREQLHIVGRERVRAGTWAHVSGLQGHTGLHRDMGLYENRPHPSIIVILYRFTAFSSNPRSEVGSEASVGMLPWVPGALSYTKTTPRRASFAELL